MFPFEVYKMLSQSAQAEILSEQGIYLELIRSTAECNVELYALGGFYVEMFFDKWSGEPLFLRAFNHGRQLEPYLRLIDIDGVFQTK